jgi:hypothetical protein
MAKWEMPAWAGWLAACCEWSWRALVEEELKEAKKVKMVTRTLSMQKMSYGIVLLHD